MKKVTLYIAGDGTQFDNEKDCILYERKQKAKRQEIDNLLRSARRIKEICVEHYDYERKTGKHPCTSCPIWQSKNEMIIAQCPFAFEENNYEPADPITPYDWGLK